MTKARLENWTITGSDQLCGQVFGHPRFDDGESVVTGRIVRRDPATGEYITTNTEYVLGSPRVSDGVTRVTTSNDVEAEMLRQDKLWGTQTHSIATWLMILGEEFGEAAKAGNEYFFNGKSRENLREELVQTAAVALQMVKALDDGRL